MKKKKILLIDDNEDIRDIFRIHFESAGFLVYVSEDGLKGITEMLDMEPDIILLDLMMPQMDGFEVLDTIQNYSSIDVPVVICSNISQKKDIQRAYELGAEGYIKKSDVHGKELVKQVSKFLK